MTERTIETIRVDVDRDTGDGLWPSPDITAFVTASITWSDGSVTTGQTFAECAPPGLNDVRVAIEAASVSSV